MKSNGFPAMAESGWLTRSLEQAVPYEYGYLGSINGNGVKKALLDVYNHVENHGEVNVMLTYLFQTLVKKRELSKVILSAPANLTIDETLNLLRSHIECDDNAVSGVVKTA